ncbi:hypothetical protein [Butyrivibrio sp. YAB3001]|uniref:hypothetical protein n=1 Tax=Butyrivibrio sp. YAB3001 TaxID=1520812 RepID=UPI0008F64F47|nr:hypothetical protein [Butyrivibrio sp. YAB3001]SFB71739.1 hypothetical protein SAMN02910398_00410 [Butyrivibrio sp. YAB3001]
MKPTKKNRFFTFIFSFCPGAAEMYLGFMKNGVSMMAIFFGACGLLAITAFDFLLAVIAVVWFYAFFHARNVAKMDDESFAHYKDMYVWEEFDSTGSIKISSDKLRLVASVALILIGASILWSYVTDVIYKLIPESIWGETYQLINSVPNVVIAIALIAAGVILVNGKKKELSNSQNVADVVATNAFTEKDNSKEA